MERVTGLRLKKACRNWNRQTGGRWPKEGTLNIWEIECCETLLERRGHGCCNRGMYRPEYYFRWKSVALLRARKPREQLSDKESRVMISREERGADPTAAVSPPVAAADAERRRKPNSDLLYPVLPEVSPLPPPPPAPHPPAQVPPPPGRAEPSAPAAEGGPGPSVKQEESSYDEEDEEDDEEDEEEVSKGRDSKGRSRRLQRKGKKEGKHQFPLVEVPNPRLEGGPIMVVQRNWEPGEIKDVAEALPNPRKSGGIQFYAAVKDMDGVYQPSAWELSQVLKKKLGPAWAALGVSWDTGIQRLDNARWAQQMNSLENALKSRFPTTVDWSRLHAARQGDKEDVYDWELRLQSLMEQYSGAGVEQQGQMMAAFYVEGLQPEIRELLKQVCPDWRERNMAGVRAFAQNIERNLKDTEKRKSIQEEKKKGKREKEHEMLFQAVANLATDFTGKPQGRGRGRGRGQGPPGPPRGGDRKCWNCGSPTHFYRNCPALPQVAQGNQAGGGGEVRPGPVMCYVCKQQGHLASQCPTLGAQGPAWPTPPAP